MPTLTPVFVNASVSIEPYDELSTTAIVTFHPFCAAVTNSLGPLDSYDDVLRNDAELFGRYRRELVARGIFEMPESLGRSHISAAHTAEDIDRSLEAAEEALRAAVDARAGSAPVRTG